MNSPTLKLTEPTIDPKDPWRDDALRRKPVAEALTNLIKGEPNPLVITVNGSWGSGKTFLLKRWEAQLKLDGHTAIYFSAWENDHCGDPLVAIIGELWEALKDTDASEIVNTVKESAKSVITDTVFNAVRAGTGGIVDFDPEKLKSVAEKAIGAYASEQDNKEELRRRLSKLARKVAEKSSDCPLVFIIDELDRCRPTYAIELLERIKHIFNIPNMVFVLGTDRAQLDASVRAVYGTEDADGYLRRFFDMEFTLPPADIATYCKSLIDRHGLEPFFQNRMESSKEQKHLQDYRDFVAVFPRLCEQFGVSLRDLEHLMRVFVFVVKNLAERDYLFPNLIAILLLLRAKEHDLYAKYLNGQCYGGDVLNRISTYYEGMERDKKRMNDLDLIELNIYLAEFNRAATGKVIGEQLELLSRNQEATSPELLSNRTRSMSKESANKLFEAYQDRIGSYYVDNEDILDYVKTKLELAANMVNK